MPATWYPEVRRPLTLLPLFLGRGEEPRSVRGCEQPCGPTQARCQERPCLSLATPITTPVPSPRGISQGDVIYHLLPGLVFATAPLVPRPDDSKSGCSCCRADPAPSCRSTNGQGELEGGILRGGVPGPTTAQPRPALPCF